MDLKPGTKPSPTKRKLWLDCECGFSGFISSSTRSSLEPCPHCETHRYEQLALAPARPEAKLPAGWEQLSPEQRARVERYIATLLAEQLRLL